MLVLALGLTTFGAGCSDTRESAAEADGTEPLGIGNEVTVPIAAAQVNVVDSGSEPRSLLRPSYYDGTIQAVTLRTDHHIQQQIDAQQVRDFSSPALTIPMTATADSNGVALTLGEVTTPDPALSEALTAADGSHAGLEMSELGGITALRLAPSPETSNSARVALEQAFYQAVYRSITFPDEPVGVGAVWQVQQTVGGGVDLDQVTTATLVDRDGGRLYIRLDVTQTPQSSIWDLPNAAGTLDIEDYTMQGSGEITVDLGLPLPVAGSITIGGHQFYRNPRNATELRQVIETNVSWGD
ncbi:hypothetical protein HGA15_21700 [Nocardia flavorosea]|uniref:Uncharacterized protein n=2 Tax=Nocardia flavorosea TaxID=53429 RepID=A0A846YII7_9NOCA|nr:hypothetical protein [Nocardia flavorosea]NKY58713.1 hypothetical protein [Nocardia flavorosea]